MEQRCFGERWEWGQFKHLNVRCSRSSQPRPLALECRGCQNAWQRGDGAGGQRGGVQPQPAACSRLLPAPSPALPPVPAHCSLLITFLSFSAGKELREDNKDYQQVLLDVRRSLRRFPPGERGFSSSRSPGEGLCRGAPPGSVLTQEVAVGDAPLLPEPGSLGSRFLVSSRTAASPCSGAVLQPSASFSCPCCS